MYHIPADLDLHDIVGSEIALIGWGQYQIQFHFQSGRLISVEGLIELWEGGRLVSRWTRDAQWENHLIQNLFQVKVRGYGVECSTVLAIHFENGFTLRLHDDSNEFESMQIEPGSIII